MYNVLMMAVTAVQWMRCLSCCVQALRQIACHRYALVVIGSSEPCALEPSWPHLAIWGLDYFLAQGRHPCPCRGRRWYSPPIYEGASRNGYPQLDQVPIRPWVPSTPEAFSISAAIRNLPAALPNFMSLMALITSSSSIWGLAGTSTG